MEFASANLRHLLPAIPTDQHDKIIMEIVFNQAWAGLDEDSFFLFDHSKISDPNSALSAAKQKPLIFCTFHFGSYRLINALLCRTGINFILPVTSDIFTAQKNRYEENVKKVNDYFKSSTRMEVVNAEAPATALTLARKVRAGWSMLAYIDGNTGVQGVVRRDAKMLRTSLLGKPIFARKGIAFISHFLGVPIVPVICEITGPLERVITFHDQIDPPRAPEERETYCQAATEKLYSILGEYLKKAPAQWEGWLSVQQYLDIEKLADDENARKEPDKSLSSVNDISGHRLVFNHGRFGFIVQDGGQILFDKATYKFLSLPQNITKLLEAYREPVEIHAAEIPAEEMHVIRQLISRDMLAIVSQ